jgi:hypothetical protein
MVLPREEQELLLEKSGERATEHELHPKLQRSLATHKHCLTTTTIPYHPVATSFSHFQVVI